MITAGSIGSAINLIVTIATERAPGMTMRLVPLFVWMTFVTSVMILFALPALGGVARVVAERPAVPRAFLRSRAGRIAATVAALFLDFRTSRGLHRCAAGVRDDLGNHSGVLAQADLRVSVHGDIHGRDRVPELWRLGASYVRGGAGTQFSRGVCRSQHADRRANRDEDLQLDRHHVGRGDPIHYRDALRRGVPLGIHRRRAQRRRFRGGSRSTGN